MHMLVYKDALGASSVLVDGFKLGEYMRQHFAEYFSLLSHVSFHCHLNFHGNNYNMRRFTFGVDSSGNLKTIHFNNYDRQPLDESLYQAKELLSCDDDDEAMRKMYPGIRCFHQLLYSDRFHNKFDLRPRRMLMYNNKRVLHSRKQLISGFRVVCGLFHSEQEWLSKLEKMEQDLG
ncbi:uncharacterized protein [Dysidea avara]|uniref:uncharacterized protein n=1 Tax=Dysidea avara TaxID=196820 RepID=UPI003319CD0B